MSRRNPNHYGCVTRLSGKRSRPWMVKVTTYDQEGNGRQTPIGYAATKEEAMIILAEYNKNPWKVDREKITFNDLYSMWLEVKAPQLGKGNVKRMKAGFNWCKRCYGMKYRDIKSFHMQACVDECPRSRITKASIQNLFGHLDRFAFELDLIDKMYSQLIEIHDEVQETTRTPFTEDQIQRLWKLSDDPMAEVVLIYIYTGFRLNELLKMKTEQVDTEEWLFTGGEKTTAGKDRQVPIHKRIRPFVLARVKQDHEFFITNTEGNPYSESRFYIAWKKMMQKIDADKTPHEARHTFETLLDNAGGNRKCIDMLMGHKSMDIGNRVYNHKTLDQLRETINLLK